MEDELTRCVLSELGAAASTLSEQRLLDGDGLVPGFTVERLGKNKVNQGDFRVKHTL